MWPGYKELLVFLGTQNAQIALKTMDTTQIIIGDHFL